MKKLILGVTLFSLVVMARPSYAEVALAAKFGTLGGGADAIVKVNDRLNARVGGNFFQYSYDGTESDIKYDFDAQLFTIEALLDWFPFQNGFHVSGGALFNQNELDADAQNSASYTIGNTTYTAAQVGSLHGNIDFNEVAPYLGIGWGTPFGKEGHWSFLFDIGAMYQGKPNVDLTANGTLASNAAFLTDIQREEENLQDQLDKFQVYPIVSLALAYRF
jgi:hypothetical protein